MSYTLTDEKKKEVLASFKIEEILEEQKVFLKESVNLMQETMKSYDGEKVPQEFVDECNKYQTRYDILCKDSTIEYLQEICIKQFVENIPERLVDFYLNLATIANASNTVGEAVLNGLEALEEVEDKPTLN